MREILHNLLILSLRYLVSLFERRSIFAVRELASLLCDLRDAHLLRVRRQRFVILSRSHKCGEKENRSVVRAPIPEPY